VFHHQRYNARGGGLCIYVRVGLTVQPIICSFHATAFEHFQLAIASVSNPITISAIYRPPNSSINIFLDEFLNYIEYISEFNLNFKPTICIAGDFNINLLSTENNTHVSEFLDIMYSHYLFPTILKPTRLTLNSATLIDNIFINNPYYMKSGLLFADISDHLPIFTVFKRPTSTQDKHVLNNKLTRLYFRNYSLHNVNKFTHILENCSWNFISENSDVNEDYYKFLTLFLTKFNICFPESYSNRTKSKIKPWMTTGILTSCKHRQKLYRQMIEGKIAAGIYKTYRNNLNNLIKKAKIDYFSNYITQHKKDSKAMWNLINSQIGRGYNKSSALNHISADILNKFFVNLGSSATKNIQNPSLDENSPTIRHTLLSSVFLTPTTPDEIITITKNLAPKTSCGFDNIPLKLVKQIIIHIATPLSVIFNKCLEQGSFPDLLKIARITPIFKNGNVDDPKNYRPISVLPSFSKILERIIHTRLDTFFNKHNILHASQHGFRTNHNTTTAITDVLESVTSALDKKLLSIALFIDISKAFDSLNHNILLVKLNAYGVRGTALKLMENYLHNRFHYTVVNNVRSQPALITMGIPQGSILGPLLFNIYVNDIFNVARSVKCVLYADDTVIVVSAKSIIDVFITASHFFGMFSKWFALNKLCLNDSKTHFLIFGFNETCDYNALRFDNHESCDYNALRFDNHTVKRVNEVRYLGVVIDDKLCWKSHIDYVRDKVAKGVGMIKMCYSCLPKQCMLAVYHSFVLPFLQYGIVFWGTTYSTYLLPLLVLQKHSIRLICHVNRFTHCAPYAHGLRVLLLDDLVLYSLACFMFKVNNMSAPDVICCIFKKSTAVHNYVTRCTNNFYVPRCLSSVRLKFIAYQGVICWNALPTDITNLLSLGKFRRNVYNMLSAKYLL
jgi:hypothetical protein